MKAGNTAGNALAKRFKFYSLIKFAMPTIIMMEFMALYTMADGIFVSRYVSTNALAAVNIVMPFFGLIGAIGIMLATGGSAIVAKQMGEGKNNQARANFTFFVLSGIIIGIIFGLIGFVFIDDIIKLLGSNDTLFRLSHSYLYYLLFFIPMVILQMIFSTFFITAGKPSFGLGIVIAGGTANFVFDYLFVALWGMEVAGAAIATGIGCSIPAIVGIIYFLCNKKGTLYFTKPKFSLKILAEASVNGSSEMVTQISMGLITFLFNLSMMNLIGENGVAAITISAYAEFILVAAFIGYANGIAPVISYKYGEKNTPQLKRIFFISLKFLFFASLTLYAAANLFAEYIIIFFTKDKNEVFDIALSGFRLFSISFLLVWFNIFASALFTALSNGLVSAAISFIRTFVLSCSLILILPKFLGVDGVWLAVPIAEAIAIFISFAFIYKLRRRYGYLK